MPSAEVIIIVWLTDGPPVKVIVAVDEDVDPSNMDEVLWALGSRSNPIDDIDILRNTWSTPLDPSQGDPSLRPYGFFGVP